jgi:hypothetical protein
VRSRRWKFERLRVRARVASDCTGNQTRESRRYGVWGLNLQTAKRCCDDDSVFTGTAHGTCQLTGYFTERGF